MNNVMREYRPGKYAAGNVQNRPIHKTPAPKRRTVADKLLRILRNSICVQIAVAVIMGAVLGILLADIIIGELVEREAPAKIDAPAEVYSGKVTPEP